MVNLAKLFNYYKGSFYKKLRLTFLQVESAFE